MNARKLSVEVDFVWNKSGKVSKESSRSNLSAKSPEPNSPFSAV